jgi:hypothetical protein
MRKSFTCTLKRLKMELHDFTLTSTCSKLNIYIYMVGMPYTRLTHVYINIQRLISIHPKHVMLTYVEIFSSIILTFFFVK